MGDFTKKVHKKHGYRPLHVYIFDEIIKILSKFEMCGTIKLLLKISRKSLLNTHMAHLSEFSKTTFCLQYDDYSSYWRQNVVFENSLRCAI